MVSFPQVSPPEPCAHLSSPPIRVTCPAHLILLDFTTRKIVYYPSKETTFYLETATCFSRLRPTSGYQYNILKYGKMQYMCIHHMVSLCGIPEIYRVYCNMIF